MSTCSPPTPSASSACSTRPTRCSAPWRRAATSITGLFEDIAFFNDVFPTVQANGQVLIQAWLDPTVLTGGEVDVTDPAGIIVSLLNGVA